MKQILLVLFCIFLLNSCDTSSPKEIATAEIEEIFEQIRSAYNLGDVSTIMQQYHYDFLHNGFDYQDEEIVWEIRLNEYSAFDFDVKCIREHIERLHNLCCESLF